MWALLNAKPCPNCGALIERTGGCNHMTCKFGCGHEFCWMCLDSWRPSHTDKSGGFYQCNFYQQKLAEGALDGVAARIETAKAVVARESHFASRFTASLDAAKEARSGVTQRGVTHAVNFAADHGDFFPVDDLVRCSADLGMVSISLRLHPCLCNDCADSQAVSGSGCGGYVSHSACLELCGSVLHGLGQRHRVTLVQSHSRQP
jgi:hypothetical protein